MYVFHSTVRLKPGNDARFLAMGATGGSGPEPILSAPGFIKRLLLRDKEHAGVYFYMSFWESFGHLEAYRATEAVRATVSAVGGADLFAAPLERVECEVVHDDVALPRDGP